MFLFFFSSQESSFILAHWLSTLGRACSAHVNGVDPVPCQAVFQAQVGFGTAGSHGAPPPGEETRLASGKAFFFGFHSQLLCFWICEKKFLIESNSMNSIQTLHYWSFRPTHSIMPLHCWLSSVSIHDLLGNPRVIFFVFSPDFHLSTHPKLMIWIHVWLNRSATLLLWLQAEHSVGLGWHV